MARFFVVDGREMPDTFPGKSNEDVRGILADLMPELHNAETKESKRGEDTIVEFRKRTGTKGG